MDNNTKSIDALFKELSERLERVSNNSGVSYFIRLEYSVKLKCYCSSLVSNSSEAYSLDPHVVEDYCVNPDPIEALEGLRKYINRSEKRANTSN